ncbi:MAG: PKD domain containing, partial [Desulfobulbaceae bacterium]
MFTKDYPTLQSASKPSRTQKSKLKLLAIIVCFLITALPPAAVATVYKQINFEWEYDTSLSGLAGYILYQDEQHLQTINDQAVLAIDLSVGLEPGHTTAFTMKAFDEDGNESAISAPYSLDVPEAVENNNFLPTILLSLSALSGDAPLEVQFSAAGSTDFDGTIVSYEWNLGDGGIASSASGIYTFVTAGTYTVTLTATDNDGGVSEAQRTVTVSGLTASNAPPTAHVTLSASSGQAPLLVEFSPDGSMDPDGTIAFYAWDFGDGESALTSTASHVSHTYTIAGTYVINLTVTDNAGGVALAQTTVIVSSPPPNVAPTAMLNLSTSSGRAPMAVEFSAEGSSDSDGTIVSYLWDFGDGGTAVTSTASYTYSTAGIYTVTLTVRDNNGTVGKAQSSVTVQAANKLPTAVVTLSPQSGKAPFDMGFSASGTTDVDGTIVSYAWTFGDGGFAVTDIGNHTFTAAGVYIVTLTVTDNNGGVSKAQGTVTVAAANKAPTALVTLSTLTGKAPLAIDFSAAKSTDSDGSIVKYAWNFGDQGTSASSTGSHSYSAAGTHSYSAAGTYPVTLTVTDNEGAVGTATTTVTVAAANKAPTALLTLSTLTGKAPLAIDFSAAKSTDSDGTIVKYAWNFGDQGTSASSTGNHSYSAAGTYPVTLTVTDNEGAVGTATTTVTVAA